MRRPRASSPRRRGCPRRVSPSTSRCCVKRASWCSNAGAVSGCTALSLRAWRRLRAASRSSSHGRDAHPLSPARPKRESALPALGDVRVSSSIHAERVRIDAAAPAQRGGCRPNNNDCEGGSRSSRSTTSHRRGPRAALLGCRWRRGNLVQGLGRQSGRRRSRFDRRTRWLTLRTARCRRRDRSSAASGHAPVTPHG